MALEFSILKWEWDSVNRVYRAEVEVEGCRGKYDIQCENGSIRYLSWLPNPTLLICDLEDMIPSNGEVKIEVRGGSQRDNSILQRMLTDFMKAQNEHPKRIGFKIN